MPPPLAELLMNGIHQMKQLMALKCSSSQDTQEEINKRMEQVVAEATSEFLANISQTPRILRFLYPAAVKIAENSTEYVNRVLDRMKNGNPSGGLEEF